MIAPLPHAAQHPHAAPQEVFYQRWVRAALYGGGGEGRGGRDCERTTSTTASSVCVTWRPHCMGWVVEGMILPL